MAGGLFQTADRIPQSVRISGPTDGGPFRKRLDCLSDLLCTVYITDVTSLRLTTPQLLTSFNLGRSTAHDPVCRGCAQSQRIKFS